MKNISRTQIVAALAMVTGLASMLGFTAPAHYVEQFLSIFTDDVFAAIMVVGGAITAGLRMITSSAPAAGVKGLLFKEPPA